MDPASTSMFSQIWLMAAVVCGIGGMIIWGIVRDYLNTSKRRTELSILAHTKGYQFTQGDVAGHSSATYNNGTFSDKLSGVLSESGNVFDVYYQKDVRGSGKRRREYRRTILRVATPDILTQFIINSRLNNIDDMANDLSAYNKNQTLKLEGNFSDFFDVLTPEGDQRQLLMLLAPDVMEHILYTLSEYDIEVRDGSLFVYAYKYLDAAVVAELIPLVDTLVVKARLRLQDARPAPDVTPIGARYVSRTVSGFDQRTSLKKRQFGWIILIVVALWLAPHVIPYLSEFLQNFTALLYFFAIPALIIVPLAYKSFRHAYITHKYRSAIKHLRP